jgi:hypothetical protein
MRNRREVPVNHMGTGWDLADGIKQPQSAHPVCNHQYSTTIILGQKIIGGEGLLVGIACHGIGKRVTVSHTCTTIQGINPISILCCMVYL